MNTTPIEFMAWDKEDKCFCSQSWINGNLYFATKSRAIELMQLTALRSINDEPIYNHMIVKTRHRHYLVNMFDYDLMYTLSTSDLEIVGNRFQHSELLELCK